MRKQMFGWLPRLALGLLAALVMALGLCPATGLAEEIVDVGPEGDPVVVAQGEGPALEAQAVPHTHDGIEFTAWTSDSSLPSDTGNYYLTKDVTLSGRWDVDTTIRLCLNGHKVTLANDDALIYVYGTLELYDEEGGNGTIDGGNKVGYSCVSVVNQGSSDDSTFNMHGGTITGGGGDDVPGGGVRVTSRATFNMSGGTITGNTAGQGGGVYEENGATFNMSGGTITGNAAEQGGGVYEENGATFNMSGGTITGNAAGQGGGVYVPGGCDFGDGEIYPSAAMNVSGGASVTGNTDAGNTQTSNVYVGQGVKVDFDADPWETPDPERNAKITVAGALAGDASFGVTMPEPGTFTIGFKNSVSDADPAKYFASDDDGCIVTKDADGEGKLAWGYSVKVAEGIQNGTVMVDKERAAAGDSVKIIATPADGYELDTVTVTEPGGRPVGTKDGSFTMPADDVTVSATFKKKDAPTPTPEPTPSATVAKAAKPKTVAYVSKSEVAVSWKAARGAKSYQLQWRKAGAEKWTTAEVKGKSKKVTGLKAGTCYEFRVRGVNGKAKGKWSSASLRWLKGAAKAKAAAGKSTGSVKATWKADKAATGGFKVFVYSKKGGKAVKTKVVKAGATSATVKGLKSGKTYYVRVCPYRAKGGSTYDGAISGYRAAKAK